MKCQQNEFGGRFIHIGLENVAVAAARVVELPPRCSNKWSSDLLPLNMLPVWFFSMSSSCALRRPKLAATSELRVSPLMMNDGLPGSAFVGEVQVPVSMRVSVWVGTRFKVGFKVELGGPGQDKLQTGKSGRTLGLCTPDAILIARCVL